jgi:hypothetical protein
VISSLIGHFLQGRISPRTHHRLPCSRVRWAPEGESCLPAEPRGRGRAIRGVGFWRLHPLTCCPHSSTSGALRRVPGVPLCTRTHVLQLCILGCGVVVRDKRLEAQERL